MRLEGCGRRQYTGLRGLFAQAGVKSRSLARYALIKGCRCPPLALAQKELAHSPAVTTPQRCTGEAEQTPTQLGRITCGDNTHRVLSGRLSLRSLLRGRVIDYWLEQAGARGAAAAQTRELQAGHGSQLISPSLEAAELNLEQGSD
ncbi:hypothetical protein EYF80_014017 [Liparis tanakae]|uniref:Uncharacterized protein n=1 Tax=Liparis tanakae TaxID=230148 RepID=A0A4Z2IE15_9TELE|nr:hypothetical protein EYF80_014017 [Liparis tanakae]